MSEDYKDAPYGYCPVCGAKGVSTERRINGNTTCENGHIKPRASFNTPTDKEQVEIEVGKDAKVGNITINKESKTSFLGSLEESINLQKLTGANHITVRNAFFANYVAAMLLLKLQDLKGLMLINDHHHSMLTKFSPTMSDLNFWGRSMFYANDADVKNRMNKDEAKILAGFSKYITTSRIQKIMKVPLTAPDSVDWNEAIAALKLAQNTFGLQSSYFNSIVRTLYNWDKANIGSKQKAINDTLMFLMQSDPSAKVIPHLRKLSNLVMTGKLISVAQRIVGFIKEDGEGGDGGATSTANVASSNAILSPGSATSQSGFDAGKPDMNNVLGGLYKLNKMAPKQITKKGRFTIRAGKLIKKKVKSFEPKKFKAPEFLRPTKKDKQTKEKSNEVPSNP